MIIRQVDAFGDTCNIITGTVFSRGEIPVREVQVGKYRKVCFAVTANVKTITLESNEEEKKYVRNFTAQDCAIYLGASNAGMYALAKTIQAYERIVVFGKTYKQQYKSADGEEISYDEIRVDCFWLPDRLANMLTGRHPTKRELLRSELMRTQKAETKEKEEKKDEKYGFE